MLLSRSLDTSTEMLATTLRSIGDAVLTTGPDARITFMNRMAELLTGWSAQEALGHKSFEVFRVKDERNDEPMICPVMRVLENGASTGYSNHTLVISRDGTERTIAYNATPIRNEGEELLGVVLVFHSSRPHTGAEGEDRLSLIAKATNDAVWDYDIQGSRMWWNDAVTTLFGYDQDNIRSDVNWYLERIHPADREDVRTGMDACQRDGRRYWQREYRFKCRNGSYSAILERGYVLQDQNGRAVRLVGTMMDITERREAQEELLRINAELERTIDERTAELRKANKELESFTYSVSHDLRSPLRNIIASSRILQEDADHLDDESRHTLTKLVQSASRMSHLIDDLLQYSRLSRSKLKLAPVDLSAVAESVATALKDRDSCLANVSVMPGMEANADEGLVTILFENLIENACKFSSCKEDAVVEVGRRELRGEPVYFVKDNGIGFDPAEAGRLFQPFERLHDQAEYPGTGIGLANCERIVRRHGGRIWAESSPGQGATFFFTL